MATKIKAQPKICEICRISFSRKSRCAIKYWNTARFCSLKCRGKQTFSSKSREIMTATLIRNSYKIPKGAKPWNWIEDRSKIKVGDRSFHDPRYKEWHKAVKNRDGWKCKISNSDCSGRLEAHHIILPWSKFPALRYEINNGIALCHFHHPRKRDDEEKWSPYFQSLVASQD